jgi:hypothetical protein
MSPVKYELGFYIPGDGIIHSDRRETLKSLKHLKSIYSFRHLTTFSVAQEIYRRIVERQ